MKGHWEEMYAKFEELLDTSDDSSCRHFKNIWEIARCSPDAAACIKATFKAHVKKDILDAIDKTIGNSGSSLESPNLPCILLDLKQQQTKKTDVVFGATGWETRKEFRSIADRAFDEISDELRERT